MGRKNIIIIVIAAIVLILAVYLVAEVTRVKPIRKINLPTKGGLGTTTSKSTQKSGSGLLPEPGSKYIPEPLPEPGMEKKDK